MTALVSVDVRRIPAMCAMVTRQRGWQQRELAERIGVHPADLSRFLSAMTPGGLLDRVVDTVTELATESEAVPQS